MGKGHRRCEVCGIREIHTGDKLFFSKFPLDPDRCREWLKAVGNEELVHLPIEKLHDQRNVCANHFRKVDFNKKGNRLKRHAIPTLHLMASPLTDSQLAEFPQHVYRSTKPQDSTSPVEEDKENMTEVQSGFLSEPIPSTSQQSSNILMELSCNEGLPRQTQSQKRSGEIVENKSKLIKLSQAIPNITGREQKLMEELKKAKCSLASLRPNAKLLENLESSVLKEIVTSALKIVALAIYKRSPKLYRYLLHLMPLPSPRTLQNVLKKIPVTTGINEAVIQHLKKVAPKKDVKDRLCGLVFDEIALKRRVLYDNTTDKIEGYEDFGVGRERNSKLADHALVFMLQGIRAKFKQPIAFYFVNGTVSSQKLALLIKEIIMVVEETGFQIITTICDQGPTNMGALKLLRTFTPQLNITDNYFYCNDKKIYIIYDVPHLFKSIRNIFLKYGVISMSGMQGKWEHLKKVEELNKSLLYLSKITAMHVEPKYRAKMKVKYAAQILSTTVSAVIKLIAQMQNDATATEEMMQTGTIIHDLDRLFDKTNGPSSPNDIKRGRREIKLLARVFCGMSMTPVYYIILYDLHIMHWVY